MARDLSQLAASLEDRGRDGFVLHADGDLADQYYLSGFDAPDPFLTLYTPETLAILTSPLEYGRAKVESDADTVRRLADYDFDRKRSKHGRRDARRLVRTEFLYEFGAESVLANRRFPLETADGLREEGIDVSVDDEDVLGKLRARKTETEIDHIRRAQQATEAAMAAAEERLVAATIEDGRLHLDGEALTSERVKAAIERTLLDHGFALADTIVASGAAAASPHDRGSGPIEVGEAVVVDIFPRSKESKYHADMTRTFLRGEPDPPLVEFHERTREAKAAALETIEAGVTGAAVHDAVCDVYEEAGYKTLRSEETAETGFIHSTGHGVGLDVHEEPRLGPNGKELEVGNVVTVEPGLYDPAVGGVRIEDLVVVTEDGYENLTEYHEELVV